MQCFENSLSHELSCQKSVLRKPLLLYVVNWLHWEPAKNKNTHINCSDGACQNTWRYLSHWFFKSIAEMTSYQKQPCWIRNQHCQTTEQFLTNLKTVNTTQCTEGGKCLCSIYFFLKDLLDPESILRKRPCCGSGCDSAWSWGWARICSGEFVSGSEGFNWQPVSFLAL